jgi:hypothetical protein
MKCTHVKDREEVVSLKSRQKTLGEDNFFGEMIKKMPSQFF